MDAPDGEGVLQHLHHRAVALAGLGREEGAEVADVEEEFDLRAGRGGGEALREDSVAGAGGGGRELGGEVGERGGAGVVREGEVGGGVADGGADAGLGGGVLPVGGGGEEGVGAEGFGGEDGGVELVDHHRYFGGWLEKGEEVRWGGGCTHVFLEVLADVGVGHFGLYACGFEDFRVADTGELEELGRLDTPCAEDDFAGDVDFILLAFVFESYAGCPPLIALAPPFQYNLLRRCFCEQHQILSM